MSRLINIDQTPKMILSASGMCEAGRIRHHLKHNLWRKETIILFVGYQSEGSLGQALQNGAKFVRLFGEEIIVHATIRSLHGTSSHADRQGLLIWLQGFLLKPEMIFINHGDDEACAAFHRLLTEQHGYTACAPSSGTEYDLSAGQITIYT